MSKVFMTLGVVILVAVVIFALLENDNTKIAGSTQTSEECWLIIDQSGGKVMRHWIIPITTFERPNNLDAHIKFSTKNGDVIVGAESTFIRINETWEQFSKQYKIKYGIPEEQIALE